MKLFRTAIVLLLFSVNAVASDTDIHPARTIVQETTDKVLTMLKQTEDETQLTALINEIILPHFDFTTMSKWALGGQWNKLDEARQTQFVSNFQQLLTNTYATALTKFDNESIDILPAKVGKKPTVAIVPTQINLTNDKPMTVSYMMLNGKHGWKVVDMSISGISIIKNYRATYASEIRKNGFDALMQKMIEKNELAGL